MSQEKAADPLITKMMLSAHGVAPVFEPQPD